MFVCWGFFPLLFWVFFLLLLPLFGVEQGELEAGVGICYLQNRTGFRERGEMLQCSAARAWP